MKAQSTLENSPTWKSLHGGSYLFGGVCFILGSFALFPSLEPFINTAIVSAWFYTVGSVYIFLSDLAEWMHYTLTSSPLLININFFLTVIGSLLILVGSAMLLPMFSSPVLGNIIYAVGSAFIFLSQTWKLILTFSQKGKTAKEIYEQDVYGVLLDISQGLGGLFYTIGTFVLMQAALDADYKVPGVILYCFGGIFYAGSGFYLNCRYYQYEKKGCSNAKSPFWQHNWY